MDIYAAAVGRASKRPDFITLLMHISTQLRKASEPHHTYIDAVAGLAHHVWTIEELVAILPEPVAKKRGTYKPRQK